MKKQEYAESAKLEKVLFSKSELRSSVQFDFDGNRHYELSFLKAMSAVEIGNMMIHHGKELIKLSKKENWNK